MSNKNNTINIDALHYDAHNFNAHTEQGRALLKRSVTDNGFGRSIVVDRDNNIKFLLYCPTLSSLHLAQYCTFIVLDMAVTYANGAVVNTSFLTNLLPDDISVMTLRRDLKDRLYGLSSQPDKGSGVVPRNYPPQIG